jgi:hypothetical protein
LDVDSLASKLQLDQRACSAKNLKKVHEELLHDQGQHNQQEVQSNNRLKAFQVEK